MKGHSKSCSCTNCAYRSYSKRSSVQHLLNEGHRIDRLFYGKYLPLRERKLLEKLIRTRAVYDGVRDQILSTSGSSDRSRSEYTFKSQGDDSAAMSRTVSKLVSLIDRGQIRSSHATLSSCCNCCSCSSLMKIKKDMKKHPYVYNKPHVPYENIAKYKLRADKRARNKRKRIGSKVKDVRFKSRNIYSESCLCTKSLLDMVKLPKKAKKAKRKQPKEDETISLVSSSSYTGVTQKSKKLSTKTGKKSIGSETPKPFPIKKDSLTLYREKMRRKRARKRTKDKALEVCDSTCKRRIRRGIKKLGTDDLLCEPGICKVKECNPEDCLKIKEASKKRPSFINRRIKKRIKHLGVDDLLCEPGVCDIGKCNPEDCLELKEASKKRPSLIRRTIKKVGKDDLLCDAGVCEVDECHPESCNPDDCLEMMGVSKKKPSLIRRSTKKVGKDDLLCDAGVCEVDECHPESCNPDDCLEMMGVSKKKPSSIRRRTSSIRRRIKKLGTDDLLCEPGVCDIDQCNPEDCLELKEASRKRPSFIRRRIKKLGIDDLLCESGVCDVEKCNPADCLDIKEASKKRPPLEDWACKSGICIPNKCDSKICYKEIVARHGGKNKNRRLQHKTSELSKADSSILTTASPKSKSSTTATNANMTKSTMPKRLKAIKHSVSQSRTTLSTKGHQIEHTLKRCFCTLKLQKKRHNLKRIRSKKTMASLSMQFDKKIDRGRKTQTKSAGIAYVVPPMGTQPRRLLPYECEPLSCTPEECDPYVCEKRIQSHYHREVTHEDGIRTYKKVTRMDTKGIKVHKPRVRYTRSQTIKSEKVKHTTPFLHRCLCNLKLFNKGKAKKKSSIVTPPKKAVKPYKTKMRNKHSEISLSTKSSSVGKSKAKKKISTVTPPRKAVKPYKTKMRNKHSEISLSTKSSYVGKSNSDVSSENKQLESHTTDKKLRKIDSNPSNKQAVRIGSSISFNVEFYKEKVPLNNSQEVFDNTKVHKKHLHTVSDRNNMREKKKSRKTALKSKGSPKSNTNLNYKSMASEVKVKEKGVFVGSATPTCFCTLKLQKKGKHLRINDQSYVTSKGTATTLELYGPKHNSECKSTSTSKCLRYDSTSFCVPATCDAYESFEEMKRRRIKRFRNSGIATEKRKRKSTMSMTYNSLSSSFKARGAQSLVAEDFSHKDKIKYWKGSSRQAVRIGSKFSFNIDFYKDRSSTIPDTINSKYNIIESDESMKLEQNSLREQRSHASSIQKEASFVGHKLKRCFCTLKFQRKNNAEKDNNRNYNWSSPVTAQFMHIAKRDNSPKPETSKINKISIGRKQHPINTIHNVIEQRKKTTSKLNIHNGSNILYRCMSKIKIKAQSLVRVNSDIKHLHLASSINVHFDSNTNRDLATVSKLHNQYQIGYLFNSNQTHSVLSNFYRSYYALNLKVSQIPIEDSPNNCHDTSCKFLDRFRPSKQISSAVRPSKQIGSAGRPSKQIGSARKYNTTDYSRSLRPIGTTTTCQSMSNKINKRFRCPKQIETEGVKTRDSASTTRQKTRKTAIATRSPKSQRAHERRDKRKSKDNSFNPKRVTNFGSTLHYSMKFYKDTSSKIIKESAQLNKPSQHENLNRYSNMYSNSINMMRKCFCTMGMQNRRRSVKSDQSIDRLKSKRKFKNPYSNSRLSDSHHSKRNSHPNVACLCNKRRLEKCECSAGDYVTEKKKKKKHGKKVTCLCKNHPEADTRTMNECDPNECRNLFQQLMTKTQEQGSRRDDVSKKSRFKSIISFRKDPYSNGGKRKEKVISACPCKSLSMMKDKTKCEQDKRRTKEYNSDEYEKKTQVQKRDQEQISVSDMTANEKRSFLSKRKGPNQVFTKDKIKIEQYKRLLDECDPQECVRIMEKVMKTHFPPGSAGDYTNEVCNQRPTTSDKKRRLLSIKSDNNKLRQDSSQRFSVNQAMRKDYKRLSCKCDKAMKRANKRLSCKCDKAMKKGKKKRQTSCKCDKKKKGKKHTCTCPQEYKRNLEEDFVGDRGTVTSRLKSIRTDRSIRNSRQKEIPEMPDELKKIVMRPPKSDTIKYGSNFSINIEFFKDSVSDMYAQSSSPEQFGQSRKGLNDEKGSPNYNQNRRSSMRVGKERQGDSSAVSQVFRSCYCSVKSLLGDRGDGPGDRRKNQEYKEQNVNERSKYKKETKRGFRGKQGDIICKCGKSRDECVCENKNKRNNDAELTPGESFIRRCFCKKRNSQDRKTLQPKASTPTIPSKKTKNKKSARKKNQPEIICEPPVDQPNYLDTIMPYCKKKFKKLKSKSKLVDSPCGVCPKSTCPDCIHDDTAQDQKKSGQNSCLCPKYVPCPKYDRGSGAKKIIMDLFRLMTTIMTTKLNEKKAGENLICPEHGLCGTAKGKKSRKKKADGDISKTCPDFGKCGTKEMEAEIKSGKKKAKTDKGKTDKGKTDKEDTDKGKTDKAKTDKGKTGKGKTDKKKTNKGKTDKGKTDKEDTDEEKTDKKKTDKEKPDKKKSDKKKSDKKKTDKKKSDKKKTDKKKTDKEKPDEEESDEEESDEAESDKIKSSKKKSGKKKSGKNKSGKGAAQTSKKRHVPKQLIPIDDTSEEDKLIKSKEVCVKVPICNMKAILNKAKGDSAGPMKPLFEMIVDTQTMDVRNKDDILQNMLSGQIKTKSYGYEHMPHSFPGEMEETGEEVAPYEDSEVNNQTATKKSKKDKNKSKTIGPPSGETDEPMTIDLSQKPLTKEQISKLGKTHHPRGCKCCDCRLLSKEERKDTSTSKTRKGGRKHVKPCSCGATVCDKESERMRKMYAVSASNMKLKECVCGSDICKRRAKFEAQDLQLYFKKQKQAEQRKLRDRERRLKRYKLEDKNIRKKRKKRDKKALNRINAKSPDVVLLTDSILDIARFSTTSTFGILRSVTRLIRRPDDAFYRFKMGIKRPAVALSNILDIIFIHSGIGRLGQRIKTRFGAMRATNIVVSEMESHPVTNSIVHVGSKRKQKSKPRAEPPMDFNCSAYMGSLRDKPCLWIYYLCPWFYPHCLGCLGAWRQFTDLLLFLFAILVWSPCILGMELIRGLMCCLVCTA